KRIGKYLLLDPDLCKSVDRVDIIIIVHTAPQNLDKRQRIRDSFAKASLFRPFDIHTTIRSWETSSTITTISRLKGVMGFRWVSEYCPNSEFVLKIDDDILVNMFKLLYSFLSHMSGKRKSIFCNLWHSGSMPILRKGKWKVASHVFSSRTAFPYDYCSGFLVLMTTDLMKPMYEAALTTPFFWIDDVYLFGMLPLVVGDVMYYNYELHRYLSVNEGKAMNCTQELGPRCPIFATLIENDFWPYWDTIKGLYTSDDWHLQQRFIH
ncbi:unnamed protein product, partial [Candidula unifasciata]